MSGPPARVDCETPNLKTLVTALETAAVRYVITGSVAAWRPQPATAEQLNHELVTPWKRLDVVPPIATAARAAPARGRRFGSMPPLISTAGVRLVIGDSHHP